MELDLTTEPAVGAALGPGLPGCLRSLLSFQPEPNQLLGVPTGLLPMPGNLATVGHEP